MSIAPHPPHPPPITNTHKIDNPYITSISGYKFQFELSSGIFRIDVCHQQSRTVFHAQFNKDLLNQLDPSIMITFDNLQTMFAQLVQIAKTQSEDITISPQGIINIGITLSLKSGHKKKHLIFETERRKMQPAEILQLKMQASDEQNRAKIFDLEQKIDSLHHKLEISYKNNRELVKMVDTLRNNVKAEVEQLRNKVSDEKIELQNVLAQLRNSVKELKMQMEEVQFSMGAIAKGFKKILLCPDMKSKCFTRDEKFIIEGNTITKIGKEGWVQLIFEQPMRYPYSFYELKVVKSRNGFICVGIGEKSCLEQVDSKWSKSASTLFLLDSSLISEGKSLEESQYRLPMNKDLASQLKMKDGDQIRVLLDFMSSKIQWYLNRALVGEIGISQQMKKHGQNGNIYPLIICNHENDKIELI